jgi:hypothetical protein
MLTTILGFLFFFQAQPPRSMHLPTSDVIDVARKVARDLGYPIDRSPNLFFFDVVTAEGGKPLFAGPHPINHFEINERTGQIVDADMCAIFDFPDLRAFQRARVYPVPRQVLQIRVCDRNLRSSSILGSSRRVRRAQQVTGSRPGTTQELANAIGCDGLKVVRKPVVPSTKSAPPKN